MTQQDEILDEEGKESTKGHGSLVHKYLLAKGYDPRFMTREKLRALGKSDDYKSWKQRQTGVQEEKTHTLKDIKGKISRKEVPPNDPTIGIDPKANMTRVAEELTPQERKRELSKSARIIRSIYKKKGMTEAKSGPSLRVNKAEVDPIRGATDAAAVLVGGKTLTNKPRDIIEIDPVMKKPNLSDVKGKLKKK